MSEPTPTLKDVLTDLYVRNGRLTPRDVLDEAADPESPLHSRFVWDDEAAGERYRLDQAARLIRSVKITVERGRGRTYAVRAFPHVPSAPDEDDDTELASYVPTETVAADPRMRALVQARMEREWRSLRRRYQDTVGFWDVVLADLPEEQRKAG